ncbi:MAG: tetratricopeptide repeat protein [Lachnospiraceae bacterium]|nr:tetratricopeptide repeat protein [Lachnospiraceae bacterium]
MEMLLMTLEEVRHGICLFQSENQAKRVSLIQERFGKEKVIVHNIADDDEEKGMVSSQDFKRWASESDAKVVIVYNLQLLGMRFGDKEVIEKLNFMRDQILAIGKLFVFGVSSYFNILLSRNARDLYSCILHHFIFQDSEEKILGIQDFRMEDLSSDDVLETSRYMEMKERIQSNRETKDISIYLECMESWNSVREQLSYHEREFVTDLAEEVDQQYMQKNIEITDAENIWILADTWILLEKIEKSAFWYEKVLCLVKKELGENHELYADALAKYSNYYEAIGDFKICEDFYDQAIKIYDEKQMKYSPKGRAALMRRANVYRRQSKCTEALEIYKGLLHYQIGKYGEKYYGNAYLYSNIGIVYKEQGELSNALLEYKKALELFNNAGKKGGWLVTIYNNICMIYLKNGDASAAWKYIKKAKKMAEDVYGKSSSKLINIYNCMAGVWSVRKRPDKELEYLQKALSLIKEIHMEDSEMASYIYHGFGNLLSRSGLADDAIAFYKYAIKIREKVYGEKNKRTASSYEQLACTLYIKSDDAEAKKMIDKARSIYVSLYGSQNEDVRRIDDYLKK